MTKHLLHFFILLFCAATLLAEDKAADLPYDVAPWPVGDSLKMPAFPEMAKMAGVQGYAQAILKIGRDGSIQDCQVAAKPEGVGFEDEVEHAVRQWHFAPAEKKSKKVDALLNLHFVFNIGSAHDSTVADYVHTERYGIAKRNQYYPLRTFGPIIVTFHPHRVHVETQ